MICLICVSHHPVKKPALFSIAPHVGVPTGLAFCPNETFLCFKFSALLCYSLGCVLESGFTVLAPPCKTYCVSERHVSPCPESGIGGGKYEKHFCRTLVSPPRKSGLRPEKLLFIFVLLLFLFIYNKLHPHSCSL